MLAFQPAVDGKNSRSAETEHGAFCQQCQSGRGFIPLEILNRELGIERLLLEGGGKSNGSFLRGEISLAVCPAVDGARGGPYAFDSSEDETDARAPLRSMTLESCAGFWWFDDRARGNCDRPPHHRKYRIGSTVHTLYLPIMPSEHSADGDRRAK